MNPFNLLINYVIANSRASFYNVSGNQEITNTALLTGMISENPILNYLIIENKAKIEGEKVIKDEQIHPATGELNPVFPDSGGTVINFPEQSKPKKTSETPTGSQTGTDQSVEAVKIESVKETEVISKDNEALDIVPVPTKSISSAKAPSKKAPK